MRKIIIINGRGRVGKDTFVGLCQCRIPTIENISSIDFVKEIAQAVGWSGQKTERDRAFLSTLKMLLMSYNGAPFYEVMKRIDLCDEDAIIFLHVREPEEIERYKKQLLANKERVWTLLIENNRIPAIRSNASDANINDYAYDMVIENNDTIETLGESAEKFLEIIDAYNEKRK